MKYIIEFEERVFKDVKKLSHPVKKKIQHAIETKISTSPEVFGKPLRGTLKSLWSLRVGSYRIIYQINDKKCIVLVVKIGRRENVYE